MELIKQERFLAGLNFEKCIFAGKICYKGIDGCYYRIEHVENNYVIEFAKDEVQAEYDVFENVDLFDDSISEFELIRIINRELRIYTMNQKDVDDKYCKICEKLGFQPDGDYPGIDTLECTEDDTMANPFSGLSVDEIEFLYYNGYLGDID